MPKPRRILASCWPAQVAVNLAISQAAILQAIHLCRHGGQDYLAELERFGLTYCDRDNTGKTRQCIHRAPLGTHEQFMGPLIEHHAGNFPFGLVSEPARLVPMTKMKPLESNTDQTLASFSLPWQTGLSLAFEQLRACRGVEKGGSRFV